MTSEPQALTPDTAQEEHGALLTPASGPSFPIFVKVLATAWMLGLLLFGVLALTGPSQAPAKALTSAEWGFLVAVGMVIASGYWGILTSRTSIGDQYIEQTWLWRKKVNIAEISQVKLISVRGLEWLMAPRLVVRTGFGLTTFHAADPTVLHRFRLLAHGKA